MGFLVFNNLVLFTNICKRYTSRSVFFNSKFFEKYKVHNAPAVESLSQKVWKDGNISQPKALTPDSQVFTACLPPPNITGTLHLGHALAFSIQDAYVRKNRMNGMSVLWVPGLDHAGIATQVVVEKEIFKTERRTRHELGRENFLQRVGQWKEQKELIMKEQLQSLGLSLDWSREFFTLSPTMSRSVVEAFVRLHDLGLIHRSKRLVNWSCHLRSAISDIEVENVEINGVTRISVPGYKEPQKFGELHTLVYPLSKTNTGQQIKEIAVCTTRPETVLGDTGLAVHPDDVRYSSLIGQTVSHPLVIGRELKIVADSDVNPELGTGVVKVTPGHSNVDFEIGTRHNLDIVNILDDKGHINGIGGPFEGQPRFKARDSVISALSTLGLYRGCIPHNMVLPVCSRSGDIVEPVIRDQWYLSCSQTTDRIIEALNSGSLIIRPSNQEKVLKDWLIQSPVWCISRQLWWGHRIPAYSFTDTNGVLQWVVGRNEEEAKDKAAKMLSCSLSEVPRLHQDEDVLDTWFSSALLPFTMLGWPDKTADFEHRYPTEMLETGQDILFFWVARMLILGLELTNKLPFKEVLLHGLITDTSGKKMSKSKGNVVDPMSLIKGVIGVPQERLISGVESLGADSLRCALLSYNVSTSRVSFNPSDVTDATRFANKMWQTARFIHSYLPTSLTNDVTADAILPSLCATLDERVAWLTQNWQTLTPIDQWLLVKLKSLVGRVNGHLDERELHLMVLEIKAFWWNVFCDVYLETSKSRLNSKVPEDSKTLLVCLLTTLDVSLRLLHPIMPHITETLWQTLLVPHIPSHNQSHILALQSFPTSTTFDDVDLHSPATSHLMNSMTSLLDCVSLVNEWRRILKPIKSTTDMCSISIGLCVSADSSFDIQSLQALTRLPMMMSEISDKEEWLTLRIHDDIRFVAHKNFINIDSALTDLRSRWTSQDERRSKFLSQQNDKTAAGKRAAEKVVSLTASLSDIRTRIKELERQMTSPQEVDHQ